MNIIDAGSCTDSFAPISAVVFELSRKYGRGRVIFTLPPALLGLINDIYKYH